MKIRYFHKLDIFLFEQQVENSSISMASTSTSSSSSQSSSILDDPSNPLYLHHEESPRAMLVYQPLVGENYPTWARSMRMALIAKNKLEFIDGTLILSSPMVKTPSTIQAWIRCNKMVASWILNSVSQEIAIGTLLLKSGTVSRRDFYKEMDHEFFNYRRILLVVFKDNHQLLHISLNWRFYGNNCNMFDLSQCVLVDLARATLVKKSVIFNFKI